MTSDDQFLANIVLALVAFVLVVVLLTIWTHGSGFLFGAFSSPAALSPASAC
jgi:hypothetical protein